MSNVLFGIRWFVFHGIVLSIASSLGCYASHPGTRAPTFTRRREVDAGASAGDHVTAAALTLPPEQAAAKAAILAECDRLADAGITFVAVHFDGSGDEGVNEDIKCYATEDYAYEECEVQNANFSYLQEHFEMLVAYGYEDDCGGFGDVILNVKTRKITVERNDRFEDYTTSSYEV